MESLIHEIALTPTGRLALEEGEATEIRKNGVWCRKVCDGFSSYRAAGLFALAATNPDGPLSPSLSFWRDFACRYLTLLCRTPEFAEDLTETIDPPAPAEIESLLIAAPPMQGGEYLSASLIREIWTDLDEWVRKEIASSGPIFAGPTVFATRSGNEPGPKTILHDRLNPASRKDIAGLSVSAMILCGETA